jgi:tRNA modification GTPase
LPRVVLAGPPNAGKSTLFNALLGRRRAIVSPVAGTTRDALEEELDLSADAPGAGTVILIDLAGLDEPPAAAIDAAAQSRARETIAAADAVIHCDPSGRFPGLVARPGTPMIRVRTKADVPGAARARRPDRAVDAGREPLAICALDGWNLPALRRAIADAAWGSRAAGLAALLPRHRRALTDAATQLREARALIAPAARALPDPALTASALRAALDVLGELVGRISPDDVIGRVFATFCVGK